MVVIFFVSASVPAKATYAGSERPEQYSQAFAVAAVPSSNEITAATLVARDVRFWSSSQCSHRVIGVRLSDGPDFGIRHISADSKTRTQAH